MKKYQIIKHYYYDIVYTANKNNNPKHFFFNYRRKKSNFTIFLIKKPKEKIDKAFIHKLYRYFLLLIKKNPKRADDN